MKRLIILLLAITILTAGLFSGGCITEKEIKDNRPAPVKKPTKPVTQPDKDPTAFVDEKFIYATEGPDPFEPVITTVIKINIDKIKLVGIIWEEGNPTALVEDENKVGFMLREGDFVDPDKNIKVVSIDKKCIVFDIRKDLFHVTKKHCLK